MKLPKIKTKKIKVFLKKLLKKLALSAFLTFLGLFFFSLILGAFIFYKYVISARETEIGPSDKALKFKEKTYQKILEVWQEKEKRFKEIDFKEYLDPFRGIKKESPSPGPVLPSESNEEKSESEEERSEEETVSEPITEQIKALQAATNIYEFYRIKGERFPSVSERAELWEEKGLGLAGEYIGSLYQNLKLLKELKKELTE